MIPPSLEKRMSIHCLESGWIGKNTPLGLQDLPQQGFCTPRPSGVWVQNPALANLLSLGGAYFPIHPSFRQCIIRAFIFSLSILQHNSSTYNAVTVAPTKHVVIFGTVATSGGGLNSSLKTARWPDGLCWVKAIFDNSRASSLSSISLD